MKKYMFFAFVLLTLSSCTDSVVKETATSYLKKQMKNPDSFKIEFIEVREDTIPSYLTKDMISLADEAKEALEEYNRYKDRSYLWADEKAESTLKFLTKTKELQDAYESTLQSTDPMIEYVAYIKYSGTNSLGGTISNKAIVIIDNDDAKKVLGCFDVDKDFIEQFITIKMVGSNFKFEFKQNTFGKYETEGLPYIEQFIINEAE